MVNPIEIDDAIVLLLGVEDNDDTPGEIKGVTRLEKLIFLLERETSSKEWLNEDAEFEPYNFGPFSQKVYQAVDMLNAAGLMSDTDAPAPDETDTWEERKHIYDSTTNPYTTRDFKLTEKGWRYYEILTEDLPKGALNELKSFKARFASIPLRTLIRYVYQRYETFTEKSVIKDNILGAQP